MKDYILLTVLWSIAIAAVVITHLYLLFHGKKNKLNPKYIIWHCVINLASAIMLISVWILEVKDRKQAEEDAEKCKEKYRQESEDVLSILREISPAIIKGGSVAGTVYANPVREPTGLGWIN